MPLLDNIYFRGSSEIAPELIAKLTSLSENEELETTLTQFGWEGQLIAGICLTLSASGADISDGRFWVRGKLFASPVSLKASKLWRQADPGVVLTITPLCGSNFKFPESLCSDYLSCDLVKFSYAKAGQPIAPADWNEYGVGEFSLRLATHMDKSSNTKRGAGPLIKFTMMIFPHSPTELRGLSELTYAPNWPGFKLVEGSAGFFPRSAAGSFGAPFLPILITRRRAASIRVFPSSEAMRFTMARIMRTAIVPAAYKSRENVERVCTERLNDQEEPVPQQPHIIWPPFDRPAAPEGRKISFRIKLLHVRIRVLITREMRGRFRLFQGQKRKMSNKANLYRA